MLSQQQKKIMAFPYTEYDAIICDGAARSGKTSVMMIAFVDWAMREFERQSFGICGKTVDSAIKNIVMPYTTMLYARHRYTLHWRRGDKVLEVRSGTKINFFEVFGGKDESSFALIQGRTLAGVLLDEVVLMPRSFVEQALVRTSVDGARAWFSCNPGSPEHWFYAEWIKRAQDHRALYLHFTMHDNPGLSERTRQRLASMFAGVFYDRYVLGLWVRAEGLVYPMFDNIVPTVERAYDKYYIAVDYGIQNATSMHLYGRCADTWYSVREYYHSGRETGQQKTDAQYYEELKRLAGGLPIRAVIIDPSAASFIALVEQEHQFKVWDADNTVLEGIQHTAGVLAEKRLLINDCCVRQIAEFKAYSWDDDSKMDAPLKENDHAMDDCRYFVQTAQIWRNKASHRTPGML